MFVGLAHNALARRKRLADGSLCVMQVDRSGLLVCFVVYISLCVIKPSASNPPCAAFNRTPYE